MAAPDPVDIRLLALVAESGKAAVHEIAARIGMDPREVAARLVALSATGLPLIVGVECDPHGLRTAIAGAEAWLNYAAQGGTTGPQGGMAGPIGPQGGTAGPQGGGIGQQGGMAGPQQGGPSGPHPVAAPVAPGYGGSSGPYPNQNQQRGYGPNPGAPNPVGPGPVGPGPGPGGPGPGGPGMAPNSGPVGPFVPPPGGPGPSGPHSVRPPTRQPGPRQGPSSVPFPAPGADSISTWGPPQSSSWARGDQPTRPATWTAPPSATPAPTPHTGRVGEILRTDGSDGEHVDIHLVEVVDPADFLFSAAGYQLHEGERAVVVHTELTNRGTAPFGMLPDLYLVLLAKNGNPVGKAPVSLSSRPPHRIGIRPGETAGGHTVYVLPEDTEITAIRWSTRPDDDQHALTWAVEQ